QYLVRVVGVGTEAGHVKVAIRTEDQAFGSIQVVGGIAVHEVTEESSRGGIELHDFATQGAVVPDGDVQIAGGTNDDAAWPVVRGERNGGRKVAYPGAGLFIELGQAAGPAGPVEVAEVAEVADEQAVLRPANHAAWIVGIVRVGGRDDLIDE